MRWIYLSPHFDDAVLSCGGLIWEQSRQGLQVEIWTVFAGDPPGPLSAFARATHDLWGSGDGPETIALRKDEDREAAARVGADLVHFDLPDCIYRLSPRGDPLYPETVFAPAHPSDRELPRRIARALRSELRRHDRLVCPLALGGHVDHVLVRAAAESLRRPDWYYADVPYVLNDPAALEPAVAALQAEHFDVSTQGLRAWLAGVSAYESQLGSLFKDGKTPEAVIRSYWEPRRGICLWRRPG